MLQISDVPKIKSTLSGEIERRRTFAIISHPDAGKTTLTEKLLLFGGVINLAGAVKARKASRHATSDWMAIERERGISVTSSVMKFEYRGFEINLLDTPGHEDFSEDTYRVLTAVDSVIMVIDSVKGVETQTRKLMEVCRMRNTPIITFINKLDREGMAPLDILADIEEKLQVECAPLSWPIGMGKSFRGTYSLYKRELSLFAPGSPRVEQGRIIRDINDPELDRALGFQAGELRNDLELLEGAANPFEMEHYLKANQTPVFFGSAINNFGVRELLDAFVEIAPAPGPRETSSRLVSPEEEDFTGFVFKIQANMDPSHRDRLAFMRVCSGRFYKGMKMRHHRLGKDITAANPVIFMARERASADEAWPGDIVGIYNHGTIKIGDTFTDREPLKFTGIPSFAPELFRRVRLQSPLKAKQLQKGLQQLTEEGAVQLFRPLGRNDFILGALGTLQFDVTMGRLESEYGVEADYEPVNYSLARWVTAVRPGVLEEFRQAQQNQLALDAEGSLVFLAEGEWLLKYVEEKWPGIAFHTTREIS